ncbi:MAG TPA: hypothetical protein VLS89_01130, partial [Candidatus Nanopelagicales bacterium]|nr:hypothetical protein [Candidatus Nanopelagicales bacterium]
MASPAGGLVFVSGPLVQRLPAVAGLVREAWRGVPACVVPAAGVLSEREEIEREGAASGLLWQGARAAAFSAPAGGLAEALGRAAAEGHRAHTAVIFARPDSFDPGELAGLSAAAEGACVIGAGTAGAAPVAISASGDLLEGVAAGLSISGLAPPVVESSPACRLLSDFHVVEEVAQGGLVLRAGGRSALELLSSCTAQSARRGATDPAEPAPVVFVALADPAPPGGDEA